MSVSFVSSTVQKETEGGGYEETPIETTKEEREAVNRRHNNANHKPLFEQLRTNQEEAEQAKRDELQREMMRGTCALDEDDVAHLEALEKQRLERERAIQEQTQSELAIFRAAKAIRQQQQQEVLGKTENEDNYVDNCDFHEDEDFDMHESALLPRSGCEATTTIISATTHSLFSKTTGSVVPKIKVVKKRKRKEAESQEKKRKDDHSNAEITARDTRESGGPTTRNQRSEQNIAVPSPGDDTITPLAGTGLIGLFSGYGSSSDDD